MKFSIRQEQVGAVAPRAALAGLLLAGSVLAFQTHQATPTSQAAAPHALLASIKPDFRGADGSNNGVLSSTGPVTLPSQVFDAHPTFAGNYTGIELDASNNVVFNTFAGAAYSFPKSGAGVTGTQNWSASTGITAGDASCNSSQIVLSTDGGDYVGADNGSLFQVAPALATGAPGVAPSGSIFTTPSGGIRAYDQDWPRQYPLCRDLGRPVLRPYAPRRAHHRACGLRHGHGEVELQYSASHFKVLLRAGL